MSSLKKIIEWLWRLVRLIVRSFFALIVTVVSWVAHLPMRLWRLLQRQGWVMRVVTVAILAVVVYGVVQLARIPVPGYLLSQPSQPVAYPHLSRLIHLAPKAPTSSDANWTYQGWTEEQRNTYYYTSQGSAQVMFGAMRYDWFVELEKPFSRERFAAPENLYRFGFLVSPGQKADPEWNPGNLPVGFTRYYDPEIKAELLDVTCSLCHTGELHYTDPADPTSVTALRVDGGQAMHAVTSMQPGQFQSQMVQALLATWMNPWKFDRFATRVFNRRLGIDNAATLPHYERSRDELKKQFGEMIGKMLKQAWFETKHGIYPILEGYGRIDAVQRIANTVFGRAIDEKNYKPGVAPVSYPHTWDISKFDWVQYQGYASQPMARNVNEALGVGARLDLFDDVGLPLPAEQRFRTSVSPERLHRIESTLAELTAPRWPAELWGEPDMKLASRGRGLFDVHCRDCHGPHRGPAFPKTPQDYDDPHLAADLKYVVDDASGEKYCTLSGERIGDQACLHLQNPQRIADAQGRPMFRLNEEGAVIGVCQEGDSGCGADPDSVEEWRIFNLPLVAIGTDRTAAANLANQRYDASRLGLTAEDLREVCVSEELIRQMDPSSLNAVQGLNLLSLSIAHQYFKDNPPASSEEMLQLMGFGILDYPITDHHHLEGYKPRPLHGIWATPPFLHNGSVRTIYQLLSPVEEREAEFWVGTKEYDPLYLGYRNQPIDGAILQQASDIGNGNAGHEFRTGCDKYGVIGPYLRPDERWAIMEYLKVMDYQPQGGYEAGLDAELVDATITELRERYPGYGTEAYYEGWQGHCSFENPVYHAPKRPQLVADQIYSDRHKSADCSLYQLYLQQEDGDE